MQCSGRKGEKERRGRKRVKHRKIVSNIRLCVGVKTDKMKEKT